MAGALTRRRRRRSLLSPTRSPSFPPLHAPAAQSPLSLVRQDAYVGLAATLDSYLADPARAAAVLPARGRAWPQLLASLAMGLRQAPTGARTGSGAADSPAPSPAAAALSPRLSYRAITAAELTAMVHVLELACLLAEQARAAALSAGLLPLLLAQLPAAPPGLATACLDALLALQLRHPPAFVAFAEQQGVQQVLAVGQAVGRGREAVVRMVAVIARQCVAAGAAHGCGQLGLLRHACATAATPAPLCLPSTPAALTPAAGAWLCRCAACCETRPRRSLCGGMPSSSSTCCSHR